MPEDTGHGRRKRNGASTGQFQKAQLHLHLLRLLLRRFDHRKKAAPACPIFCHQLLRPNRQGFLHRMRRLCKTLSNGRDHRGRQNIPCGSGSMHRLRPLRNQVQTQSHQADQERQGNRATDEHGEFVFKHPDGKSRQKKDDRQYAEASFRETLMNFLQCEDPE
jgi:hypothetical protein